MPINNSDLKKPDPFIMDQEIVNDYIEKYLRRNGYTVVRSTKGQDIDIKANDSTKVMLVESRANQALKNRGKNIVFDSSQIRIHFCEQIEQIMRFQQYSAESVIFIMGNPDIPRIKNLVNNTKKALNKLNIFRYWVKEDGTITIEFPD